MLGLWPAVHHRDLVHSGRQTQTGRALPPMPGAGGRAPRPIRPSRAQAAQGSGGRMGAGPRVGVPRLAPRPTSVDRPDSRSRRRCRFWWKSARSVRGALSVVQLAEGIDAVTGRRGEWGRDESAPGSSATLPSELLSLVPRRPTPFFPKGKRGCHRSRTVQMAMRQPRTPEIDLYYSVITLPLRSPLVDSPGGRDE